MVLAQGPDDASIGVVVVVVPVRHLAGHKQIDGDCALSVGPNSSKEQVNIVAVDIATVAVDD